MSRHRMTTASRRPTEESARSESKSIEDGSKMNDATIVADNSDLQFEIPLDGTHGDTHLEDRKDINGEKLIDKLNETCKETDTDAQTRCDCGSISDGTSLQELVKGFERLLQSTKSDRSTVPGRRWLGSDTLRAAGALLTDKMRRYWLGPTRGHTGMARAYHRQQKACLNGKIFRYTLSYIVHVQTCSDTQVHMRVLDRLTTTRCVRTGGGHDQEVLACRLLRLFCEGSP